MNSTPHVAVIGAGLAGLSCAEALQQAGLRVTVYEKSRGAAGRMSTRRGEDWQCDHGAQYFTARHPDFRAEVERWVRAGVAGMWAPRLQVLGDSFDRVPDAALERFVGVPAMTAPARHLAQALSLVAQTTITEVQRAADRWQLLTAASLLPAFGQLGGPTPQAWTAHRWRYADTEPPLDAGCTWEPDLGLGLCGDWLNGGKVEGAWLSGRALARQVLQSFGSR